MNVCFFKVISCFCHQQPRPAPGQGIQNMREKDRTRWHRKWEGQWGSGAALGWFSNFGQRLLSCNKVWGQKVVSFSPRRLAFLCGGTYFLPNEYLSCILSCGSILQPPPGPMGAPDPVAVASAMPAVLGCSVEHNLAPKVAFLTGEMGRHVTEAGAPLEGKGGLGNRGQEQGRERNSMLGRRLGSLGVGGRGGGSIWLRSASPRCPAQQPAFCGFHARLRRRSSRAPSTSATASAAASAPATASSPRPHTTPSRSHRRRASILDPRGSVRKALGPHHPNPEGPSGGSLWRGTGLPPNRGASTGAACRTCCPPPTGPSP